MCICGNCQVPDCTSPTVVLRILCVYLEPVISSSSVFKNGTILCVCKQFHERFMCGLEQQTRSIERQTNKLLVCVCIT